MDAQWFSSMAVTPPPPSLSQKLLELPFEISVGGRFSTNQYKTYDIFLSEQYEYDDARV